MTDTYPRLNYSERVPSTIPNLWDGGWRDEAAVKVYFEQLFFAFDIKIVANLDALYEATIQRADFIVRYGEPRKPRILELKKDLRLFLHTIGPDGSPLYEGIRTDDEAYKPHNLSWPSIVFAGTDVDGHRERLEREYPGEIIIADEDAPKECPTFSEFQQSLIRAFEAHSTDDENKNDGAAD